MPRLPWYSFLYRLLGAQGTFWLWIASIIGLWWTWRPTLDRLANRHPRAERVAEVPRLPALTRWVTLEGVLVRLDRRLLLEPAPPTRTPAALLPPTALLIDPSDPSARWWAVARALADASDEGFAAATAALGGPCGTWRAHARRALGQRLALLEGGERDTALPSPERAVIVDEGAQPPLAAAASPDAGRGLAGIAALLDARAALLRARVEPAARIDGLLVDTPATLAEHARAELDVVVAPRMVQEGRHPRDLESWVFAASAICLLFLAAGFHGATRAAPPPPPPAPPA
jgi:hypothetical protein